LSLEKGCFADGLSLEKPLDTTMGYCLWEGDPLFRYNYNPCVLKEIRILILVVKHLSLGEGSSANGLSLGVHLTWLSRTLMIPPWVISPVSVEVQDMWGIWGCGMPHGITIRMLC
jgi:hypothetical protein